MMVNEIVIQRVTRTDWRVYANGYICWQGSYATISVKASALARDLGWNLRLTPGWKPAKVVTHTPVIWRD